MDIAPGSIRFLLPCFIFIRLDQKWNIAAISWLQLHGSHFQAKIEFKILHSFVKEDLFFTLQPLSRQTKVALQSYLLFLWSDKLISLIPPVETFTVRIYYVTSIQLNHLYFLHIPNVKRKYHSGSFFQDLLLCGTNTHMDTSLNSTMLTSSSQRSIAICLSS